VEVDSRLPEFNMKKSRLTYLDSGDSMDARTREVTVSERKLRDKKLDPRDPRFDPFYNRPRSYADILAPWAIYEAMTRVVDSKAGVVRGLALDPWDDGPKKDLGFEFKVYRGIDTIGWYTSGGGNESYTILNAYVDILPVKLAHPLYAPLGPAKTRAPRSSNGTPR
jgi:cyanophycinase